MSKKKLSRLGIRLALIVSILTCAMIACAVASYADASDMAPKKNDKGVYEIYTSDQLEVYMDITRGQDYYYRDNETSTRIKIADRDKGASCILMNDIDYEGSELKPQMGRFTSENDPYTGTLNGNGKTIKNIPDTFANYNSNQYSGTLISYNKGVIKDVTLDFGDLNVQSKNSGYKGLLCQYNLAGGIISGVTIKGNITSNMYNQYVFCYINRGIIRNSSVHGSLTCTVNGNNTLVGAIQFDGIMENVYNAMDITNTDNGIPYGLSMGGSDKIRNCYNIGKLFRGTTERFDLTNSDSALVNCYKSTDEFTAADLGDAYMDDLEGDDALNKGYPVLKYQITGEYPHVESIDDITVESVKAVDETTLAFASGTTYSYYKPKAADFIVTATNESGISVSVTPTDLSWGKKSQTLTYSSLLEQKSEDGFYLSSTKEQKITVKLFAAGKELCTAEFTIPASDDWRDYAEEPELISLTDTRFDGKFANYYMITSAEELAWFANNYINDMNAFLAADIDLGGRKWYGIGIKKGRSGGVELTGIFDGNGYTIKNLTSYNGNGLAGSVGQQSPTTQIGVIKNVRIENGYVEGKSNAGGIAGGMGKLGSIINCSFSGEVKVAGGTNYSNQGAGGIAGSSTDGQKATITGCANYAKVTGSWPERVGGIIGHSGGITIKDCYNMGETNGAGIMGDAWSSADATHITNCYNAGKVNTAITASQWGNASDCYSLAGAGKVTGDISVFTEEEAQDGTLLEYLDSEEFVSDEDNINNGYPVLKWQSPLVNALSRYPEEITNYVNLDDYGMNKDAVQTIIDEAVQKIQDAKSFAEADAALAEAKAAIDAIPSDAQAAQQMADELARLQEQIKNANKTLAFDMCLISLDKTSFTYTGKAFEPAVKATNKDGTALVKDTDFEVVYEANTEPGVGKVKVTGMGENYAGTRELTFKILPKQNKITSLKKAKKAFTVKWTKDAKATGYQVSYGLKKNFKGAKTIKITKKTTVSKKVTKLKAKKKYFVKVRTYVTSGGQTIYGAWSPVQSVKTK